MQGHPIYEDSDIFELQAHHTARITAHAAYVQENDGYLAPNIAGADGTMHGDLGPYIQFLVGDECEPDDGGSDHKTKRATPKVKQASTNTILIMIHCITLITFSQNKTSRKQSGPTATTLINWDRDDWHIDDVRFRIFRVSCLRGMHSNLKAHTRVEIALNGWSPRQYDQAFGEWVLLNADSRFRSEHHEEMQGRLNEPKSHAPCREWALQHRSKPFIEVRRLSLDHGPSGAQMLVDWCAFEDFWPGRAEGICFKISSTWKLCVELIAVLRVNMHAKKGRQVCVKVYVTSMAYDPMSTFGFQLAAPAFRLPYYTELTRPAAMDYMITYLHTRK